MSHLKSNTYCEDIENILKHVNDDNFELATKAIETISKYAHQLSADEQVDSPEVSKPTEPAAKEVSKPADKSESGDDLFKVISTKARQPSKKAAAPINKYKVERKLIGAKVGPQYYSESMVRKYGMHGGDMVSMDPDPSRFKHYHGRLPFVTIVDVSEDPEPNIVREKVIVDSEEDGTLVAKYQYNHEPLLVDGEPAKIKLNPTDVERNHVGVGDIIEVAYYKSDGADQARVSWKYDTEADEPKDVTKPHSAYLNKAENKAKQFQPNIEYDLTNKKVLMCGYGNHRSVAQEVVDAHHGKELLMFDEKVSGKGMSGNLLNAIKHADIVIVMLNSVSHHTANQAISAVRDQNKYVAATNTNSPLAIEDAIDRAMKREPIYMPTSHVIE